MFYAWNSRILDFDRIWVRFDYFWRALCHQLPCFHIFHNFFGWILDHFGGRFLLCNLRGCTLMRNLRFIRKWLSLWKNYWFFLLWLCIGIELPKGLLDILRNVIVGDMISISTNKLSQTRCFFLHELLCSVQFIPELFLDLRHVGPGIHFVRFDVLDFFLGLFLLSWATFVVFDKIGILRSLNNNSGYFLRRLDLIYSHFVFETLLYNFCNWHVVYFLLGVELSLADSAQTTAWVSLNQHLVLGLLATLELVRGLGCLRELQLRQSGLLAHLLAFLLLDDDRVEVLLKLLVVYLLLLLLSLLLLRLKISCTLLSLHQLNQRLLDWRLLLLLK